MSSKIQTDLYFYNELSLPPDYSYRIYAEYMKSNKQFLSVKLLYGLTEKFMIY
ncbi:MAG: hypothetical protein CFH06_01455 [Alphaproteobacteria bacterium MarineAlpha3_Bin5]|nr:MAG: hypothetical protein CFH06_01455 [Alphaproteobacteria bacterium MarineAlpha3_Bin5]